MTLQSLLYVSKSLLPAETADEAVEQIAAAATVANSRTQLTGALVFTGSHFAQILEGDGAEIDRLMAVIQRDTRHRELRIVDRKGISQRRFSDWSMAYMGPSQFVSRHVLQLLERSSTERTWRASAWMSDLMAEFAKAA